MARQRVIDETIADAKRLTDNWYNTASEDTNLEITHFAVSRIGKHAKPAFKCELVCGLPVRPLGSYTTDLPGRTALGWSRYRELGSLYCI